VQVFPGETMLLIAPMYAGITHSRCKCWHYPGEILLIILWMSYFLYPQLAVFPRLAKTVSQQKKGQNFSRVISNLHPGTLSSLLLVSRSALLHEKSYPRVGISPFFSANDRSRTSFAEAARVRISQRERMFLVMSPVRFLVKTP